MQSLWLVLTRYSIKCNYFEHKKGFNFFSNNIVYIFFYKIFKTELKSVLSHLPSRSQLNRFKNGFSLFVFFELKINSNLRRSQFLLIFIYFIHKQTFSFQKMTKIMLAAKAKLISTSFWHYKWGKCVMCITNRIITFNLTCHSHLITFIQPSVHFLSHFLIMLSVEKKLFLKMMRYFTLDLISVLL